MQNWLGRVFGHCGLLTAGGGDQVRLWDLSGTSPRQIIALRGHSGIAWDVAFSPDGKQIFSCGSDGTIRYWPASFDGLQALAEERSVRDWTTEELERYSTLLGK